MSRTRTIRMELLSGKADWIKSIGFTSRIIRWLVIPRKLIDDWFHEREMSQYGIYFLIGNNEQSDENENVAYIWQTVNLKERIKNHSSEKDFWNYCICFTTSDNSFDSSDINYLENQLILQSKIAERYIILNGNNWNTENISRWKKSDIDEYIEDLEVLLWVLWFPVITPFIQKQEGGKILENKSQSEIYIIRQQTYEGKMIHTNEGFVVLEWSSGKPPTTSGIKDWIGIKRMELMKEWVIKILENESIVFLRDHLFKSPSWAGAIIVWNASNWWLEWKNKKWLSIWEIEDYWKK